MEGASIVKAPIKSGFSSSAQVLQSVNDRLMKNTEMEAKKFSTSDDARKKFQMAQSNAL